MNSTYRVFNYKAIGIMLFVGLCMLVFAAATHAEGAESAGKMASNIVGSFKSLTRLITAASYLAGLGFSIGAIMKFKQHKDNPTQIPIGTPIALVFISAALLFLPSILGVTGATMFGGKGGEVAGATGMIFKGGGGGGGLLGG